MATEIVPGLWVGDWNDGMAAAEYFDAALCVLERDALSTDSLKDLPSFTRRIGILRYDAGDFMYADLAALDRAAAYIAGRLAEGKRVLVHCGAGQERSPLTVVWYLYRNLHMPWKEAYALVMERRPCVLDRSSWLPWKVQTALGL